MKGVDDVQLPIAKNAGKTFTREFSIPELFLLDRAMHMMGYWLSRDFHDLRKESEEFGAGMRDWCKQCFSELGFTEDEAEYLDKAVMSRPWWFKDARDITELLRGK